VDLVRVTFGQESATEQQALGHVPIHELDKPRTYKDAATHLGVGYYVVQRAARRGLVQSYRLGSSRRYVKLRDFLELMTRETNG
jgi:hypothetical protein